MSFPRLILLVFLAAACSPQPASRKAAPGGAPDGAAGGSGTGGGGGTSSVPGTGGVRGDARPPSGVRMDGATRDGRGGGSDAAPGDGAASADARADGRPDGPPPSSSLDGGARRRSLLLVHGKPAGPGDAKLRDELDERYEVNMVAGDSSDLMTRAAAAELILVSATVSSASFQAKLSALPIPAVVLEAHVFDDWKLTGSAQNVDFGSSSSQTKITMLPTPSPMPAPGTAFQALRAGMSGDVTVSMSSHALHWGKPARTATVAARIPGSGNDNKVAIFAYDEDAEMVGMNAPAKRVGFFMTDSVAQDGTDDAYRLLTAAIDWALQP